MNYEDKYIKYKTKYLDLKQQMYGGKKIKKGNKRHISNHPGEMTTVLFSEGLTTGESILNEFDRYDGYQLNNIGDNISFTFSTINYAGRAQNIFEYGNSELYSNSNFNQAEEDIQTITFKELYDSLRNPDLKKLLDMLGLDREQQNKSIRSLIKDDIIKSNIENKTGPRPGALSFSAYYNFEENPLTEEQLYNYFNKGSVDVQYGNIYEDKKFKKDIGGIIKKKRTTIEEEVIGLLVWELISRKVYHDNNLHTVTPHLRLITRDLQEDFELVKQNQLIDRFLPNHDFIAVQESPEKFNKASMVNHKIVRGYGDISLIVRKKITVKLEPNMNDFIKSRMNRISESDKKIINTYLSKTTMYSLKYKSISILLVVLHLKNPKDDADLVFEVLNNIITIQKGLNNYSQVIVIGDTNLEKKKEYLPDAAAEALGLQLLGNRQPSTLKERSHLQIQIGKAKKLAEEEKDVIMVNHNIKSLNFSMVPKTLESLPSDIHRSDHRVLSTTVLIPNLKKFCQNLNSGNCLSTPNFRNKGNWSINDCMLDRTGDCRNRMKPWKYN